MLKRLSFTFAVLTIASTITCYAKIWRVNNQAGINADFTSLQAAHDGASAGDTLHIESSPNSYGGLTCTKKLIMLGTGYFLDENANSQAIAQSSKVDGITFYLGSSGSVIMGMDFRSNGINVFDHNIVIKRNKFSSPNGSTADYSIGTITLYYQQNNSSIAVNNIIISQNYGLMINVAYPSTGVLITNNFICRHAYEGEATNQVSLNISANAIALVQNNIFRRGRVTANNSSFTNNIMIVGSFDGTGNLVSNNIGNGTQFGSTNGNKENVDMTSVFVGAGTGVSTDGQWKLKTGSPAIAAGYGSTAANPVDDGMFGGKNTYMLAGLPPIPSIYYFENQPIGSNTDPIHVTIKVKSNN